MQNQTTSLIVAPVASGLAAALLCVAILLFGDSRSLRRQLAASDRRSADAIAESAKLRADQEAANAERAAQRERLAELEAQVTSLQGASQTNAGTPPRPVRVFDGNRFVGLGWVVTPPGTNAPAAVVLDRRTQATALAVDAGDYAGTGSPSSAGTAYTYWSQQWPGYWGAGWVGYLEDGRPCPDFDPHDPGAPPTLPPAVLPPVPTPPDPQTQFGAMSAGERAFWQRPLPQQANLRRSLPVTPPTFRMPAAAQRAALPLRSSPANVSRAITPTVRSAGSTRPSGQFPQRRP